MRYSIPSNFGNLLDSLPHLPRVVVGESQVSICYLCFALAFLIPVFSSTLPALYIALFPDLKAVFVSEESLDLDVHLEQGCQTHFSSGATWRKIYSQVGQSSKTIA